MFIVYKITNKNNGKSYVGYTGRTIEARWKAHLSSARNGSRFRFHSAIRKHGEDAWKKAIMLETENIKEAKKFEEQFILENDL
jgi:predicted GIY-YIG superfamily endonuclease